MPALEVSSDFGYVFLSIFANWVMNLYLMTLVVSARKKYGIKYPTLYADGDTKEAKAFNSTQRAHQNTLESFAGVLVVLLANGLFFPKLSAAFGLVFAVGRVMYGYGYTTKGPTGRVVGAMISHLGDVPLLVLTAYSGYALLTGQI